MEPAMAARYGLKQGEVGAWGPRLTFDNQADFHSAPFQLERYEAGHGEASGVPVIDWFGDQSLYIQRHSNAAALELNSIYQVAKAVGDFSVMRELFAFRLGCIERRLQVANRQAGVLQGYGDRRLVGEHLAGGAGDRALDLERRQTPAGPGLTRRPADHFARDVVTVATCPVARATRVQRLTTFVEQFARQRTRPLSRVDFSVMRGLGAKPLLHLFPDRPVHDRQMLAGMANLPVSDLTEVNRIGQQFIERTAPEWLSARPVALLGDANLRDHSVARQFLLEQTDRTEFEIAREDIPDSRGFGRINDQAPLTPVITQRHSTSHPDAFLLIESC